MATIKTISDAIISRVSGQVAALTGRVATFDGDARAYLDQVKSVPFAGLRFEGLAQAPPNVGGTVAEEEQVYTLLLIAEDFSGLGFSMESCYPLIDSVRNCLMGHILTAGTDPVEIERAEKNRQMEAEQITAYDIVFRVRQTIQQV